MRVIFVVDTWCEVQQQSTNTTSLLLFLWGQKRMAVYDLQLGGALEVSIRLVSKIHQFCDWIWDVMPLPEALAKQLNLDQANNDLCAIGTAHNRVEIWDWRQQIRVWYRQCEENCIMYEDMLISNALIVYCSYSMGMHVTEDAQLVVAVGTVFNQIWIWQPLHSEKILARLLGHEVSTCTIKYY